MNCLNSGSVNGCVMDLCMGGWVDGLMDGEMFGCMHDGWVGRWVGRWMEESKDGCMGRWVAVCTVSTATIPILTSKLSIFLNLMHTEVKLVQDRCKNKK